MLTRLSRIVLAVEDLEAVSTPWVKILGAEWDHSDTVDAWNANRSRYRLGTGWVDLLVPNGPGELQDAIDDRGTHLFAAGATTPDVDRFLSHVKAAGASPLLEHREVLLCNDDLENHGLRLIVGKEETRPPIGRLQHFYEVTNLVRNVDRTISQYTDLLGLDTRSFVPISNSHYGYEGTLTLFGADHLDRFEIITPTDPANTMGRFFGKWGDSLYMAFAECNALADVEAKARKHGRGYTVETDEHGAHTIFLHPDTLGGVMLGLSRPTYAWRWSGAPQKVQQP